MEINTIPGYRTIVHHANCLQLPSEAIHRLVSMDHKQTTWRASVTKFADLSPLEQIFILIITPTEALSLFPAIGENIYSLGHSEYRYQFRRPEWVRMSSILASTGLYFLIQRQIPITLGVARACATLCSGVFIPRYLESSKIVGEAMTIDPLLTRCALDGCSCTINDPEISQVIEFVTSQFAIGMSYPTPRLYTLRPAFAESGTLITISCIVHNLCLWFGCPELFAMEDDSSLAFFSETTAGVDIEDLRACLPVGRWMLIILKYSLMETNIRSAIKHGVYIPYFDPESSEYFVTRPDSSSNSSNKIDWYKYLAMYYKCEPREVKVLQDYYATFNPRAAELIPILAYSSDTEYESKQDMGQFDILQSKMARAALGADIWEVRNNAYTCLTRVREAVVAKKAPPKLAMEICTRYKAKTKSDRITISGLWTMGDQLLNTGLETPQYIDPGAWACVNMFPIFKMLPVDSGFPSLFDTICSGEGLDMTTFTF